MVIDPLTKEYRKYTELTPGSMIVAPCNLLGRRIGDVAPSIASIYDQAIWEAENSERTVRVAYDLYGHSRVAHVTVQKRSAVIHIAAMGLSKATGTG